MKKHIIKKNIKLLDALKEIYPDSSNKTLRDLLKNKRILIDDKTCVNANTIVEIDQTISIGSKIEKLPYAIDLLFEDNDIIIVNKPNHLLSTPLDKKNEVNLLHILKKHYDTKNIFAVHRLDKSTSGVIVFAKSIKVKNILDEMFKKRLIKKEYIAIVNGNILKDKDTLIDYLYNHEDFLVKVTNNPDIGKKAILRFEVIRRSKNFSFLKVFLETGKKHQIRVQLSNINHPILGDKKYTSKLLDPIKRICLHAYKLEFFHPVTDKNLTFISPIPKAFKKLGL